MKETLTNIQKVIGLIWSAMDTFDVIAGGLVIFSCIVLTKLEEWNLLALNLVIFGMFIVIMSQKAVIKILQESVSILKDSLNQFTGRSKK